MATSSSGTRRVNERYDLIEPLGRGGMGVVWLAEDTVLQRKVAVKEVELPPGVPADEIDALRERVLREARSAARLNHPNVTTVFDVLRDEGTTWIVMEYVQAPTLSDLVAERGPLSPQRAAEVGLGVLQALEAAHAAGIVHRDVKPGNVMVPETGHVKLADFGVATIQGDSRLTLTGLIIGSPAYMAPEQAQEGVSTAASDLWGLGATLYYAVEGEAPFDRGAAIPTLTAVAYDPPRPVERAGPLAPIIERLLAKDPHDRPTAGELHAVLQEAARGSGGADATTVALGTAPQTAVLAEPGGATAPLPEPQPTPQRMPVDDDEGWDPEPRRASVWPWLAGAAVLLLAVLLLPGLLDDGDPQADQAQEEPAPAGQQPDEPAQEQEEEPADGADETTAEEEAPAQDEEQPAEEEPADEAPAEDPAVPEDWSTFTVGDTGSTVAHPGGWSEQPQGETMTDLVDPDGGRYLRVDYTNSPGDDAVADWEQQSDAFAQSHDNYSEISIEPYDYPGAETAALWEYTYTEDGADLHAYNLAVVIGGRGYALNLQTHEQQWAESQELWEQMVTGFDPAG